MSKLMNVKPHSEAALPHAGNRPLCADLVPNYICFPYGTSLWRLGQEMVTTVSAVFENLGHFLKPGNQNASLADIGPHS